MRLAETQRAFQAQVLSEELALPSGWDERMAAGLSIYRNAYRARLIAALDETFPRTLAWVDEGPFARAAAHHLIVNPPSSWTLDDAGAGFPETLRELFANDPEVPDLASLEWEMHRVFAAADEVPLDLASFAQATASFGEEDWALMHLRLVPALAIIRMETDCIGLWKALGDREEPPARLMLEKPAAVLIWREELTPVFRQIEAQEAHCLQRAIEGASFGGLCEYLAGFWPEDAAVQAGGMLARWIGDGLVAGVAR